MSVPTSRVVVLFGAVSGIAAYAAMSILAAKYPERKFSEGSVAAAIGMSALFTVASIAFLSETQK